ncbi:Sugar transporter STL1-like protein 8 [Colletotrichum chlorophyti]|uniref:Sugar transporter STL1-like protein 8 n=1 Tax=Colletotrichum chlorophyti TaxID=708187 RepID=A0A1Q8S0J4_9PEZI|nr:Sugar transporter STL1-like protein 8 [Colletotrichum chlorophyti]
MAWLSVSAPPGVLRLYFLCLYFSIGASVWGYNIGIMSSVFASPGWKATLGLTAYSGVRRIANIASVYYIGTLLSYLLVSHPVSDWLGRRYAALCGTVVVCLGAILQATSRGATAYGTMIAGRFLSGLGVAVVSTSVPLYQAEISPAKQRGYFVTMNHVGFIAGIAAGFWVGFLMSYWNSESGLYYGWRVSILLEVVPALIFGAGLPWMPETPRWLVENGRKDQARSVLHWLREGSFDDDQVVREFGAIVNNVTEYHQSSRNWLSLFTQRALFARLWRAVLLQFMAQLCGATAIKYYLVMLLSSLGLRPRQALLAGGIEMTMKIGFTVIEMFIIDRFGRRNCLAAGCLVMALSLLINGALPIAYPNNISRAADVICVAFVFVYALGFSLGFGPTAWVYNTEACLIFPTSVRARGLNFASVGGSIGSTIVTQIWPIGLEKLGNYVYFIFMVINIICIPIIYTFLPETKGRELEDMDELFGAVDEQQHKPSGTDTSSEPLLQGEEAAYRDLEGSASEARRDQDNALSLIQ